MTENIIWKYSIATPINEFSIEMPKDSKVLTLQLQNGIPQMWVLVNVKNIEQKCVLKKFCMYGTGIKFKNNTLTYIGTYQLGSYVFHLFEEVSIGAKIIDEIL